MSPMNSVSSGPAGFRRGFRGFFPLVQNVGVGPVEKGVEAGHAALDQKMVAWMVLNRNVRRWRARQNSRKSRAYGSSQTES
jgi:hypothetical protein